MIDKNLSELALGDKISEPVFTKEGHLLLSKGTIVSYELLSKLKKHNANYFKTLETLSIANKPKDLIEEEVMTASIRSVKQVFDQAMLQEHKGVKTSIPDEQIDFVVSVVESLMETLYQSEDLLYTVTNLMDSDNYTYHHSVNVAILSILTAKSMHYSESDIKTIALGALLHDIGKANVTGGLVQKPGELSASEKDEMKKHPEYGYQLIKNIPTLSYAVKQIVRLHHEKLDGSGYPLGLTGMEIPNYVRLITVCDMYDAMTADRIYRKKMPIHTALEILMKDCVFKIDADVYRQMTSTICIFPTGQGVLLSDGRVGIVSFYRHQSPTRPKVKIVDFDVKTGSIDVEEVDLQNQCTLFIIDTWNAQDFASEFKNALDKNSFYALPDEEKAKYATSIL